MLAALYNLHQETLWLPAPSLAAQVVFPTNYDSDGKIHSSALTAMTVLEAGIRYQLTPLVVLTAGAAAGIGEDSPDFRTVPGLQKSF